MGCEQALDSVDPIPLLAGFLSSVPVSEWRPEHDVLEGLLNFYGRIYGGGLSHAIGAASEGSIPEALRLAKTYGDEATRSWVQGLEVYFAGRILSAPRADREEWESRYNEAPDPRFEELYAQSHAIEADLGKAICQYVREHPAVLGSASGQR